jgi:hypothetical protein
MLELMRRRNQAGVAKVPDSRNGNADVDSDTVSDYVHAHVGLGPEQRQDSPLGVAERCGHGAAFGDTSARFLGRPARRGGSETG